MTFVILSLDRGSQVEETVGCGSEGSQLGIGKCLSGETGKQFMKVRRTYLSGE